MYQDKDGNPILVDISKSVLFHNLKYRIVLLRYFRDSFKEDSFVGNWRFHKKYLPGSLDGALGYYRTYQEALTDMGRLAEKFGWEKFKF